MTYDPRCHGAKCDECPLGPNGALHNNKFGWKPVEAEHYNVSAIVVGDAPTKEDERTGHHFSSSEVGGPWLQALASLNRTRDSFGITTVLACRPSGPVNGAYRRMEDQLKRLNKKRHAEGKPSLPHPEECCRPRLLTDVGYYKNIITLGKVANQALTSVRRGIKKVRGSPWGVDAEWKKVAHDDESAVRKLLPTFHPRFIDRSPAYFDRWLHDIRKALRLFGDKLDWSEPSKVLWRPTPQEFAEWIAELRPTFHEGRKTNQFTKPIVCYDVETPKHRQGLRPSQIPMRTIAFSRWANGVENGDIELACISLLSTDGVTRFYSESDEKEIVALCIKLLTDPDILKIGHNAGQFDRLNVEYNFGVTPAPLLDTILPARAANPAIPKGLKPTGRTYCDVGEWDSDDKEESIATGSTDDDELLKYNGTDVQVNLKIWPELRRLAAAAGYFKPIRKELLDLGWWLDESIPHPTLCDIDHARQDRGVRMTKVGLWIDQHKRAALEEKFTAEYEYIWGRLQRLLADEGVIFKEEDLAGDEMNPNSTRHLRWLYFDKWDLPALWESGLKDDDGSPLYSKKDFLTTNGDLSTSDTVHRHYIASGVLNEKQAEIMQLVRVFRRIRGKIVGTTLRPLAPEKPIYKKGEIKGYTKSFLYPDARVHSSFSAHLTNVGRYSSRGPNCYSGDTEVLTDQGWVRFDQLDQNKLPRFITWQPDGTMRWEKAIEYHRYDNAEFMSISTDRYIDLMVTPDHGCPVFTRKGGKFQVVEAKNYPKYGKQPVAGTLKGGQTLPENRVKFVVALQADGQITKHHVRFGFNKKRKIERLRSILTSLGLTYTENKYGKTTEFRINFKKNPNLPKLWKGCLDEEKCFTSTLLKLSEESRRIFLSEIMYWDGSYTRKNNYASKHKINADIVQAMCNVTGTSARVRKYINSHGSVSWQVDVRWGREKVGCNNNRKQREPNQTAYCVTVPSKFLLVRRNNVSLISKNTQNIGNKKGQGPLKTVFAAPPGRFFLGADVNQAHLFIIANVWKIPALCEAIRKGYDPHNYNAYTTFGKRFTGAPGYNGLKQKPDPGSVADAMRNTIKIFIYASVYGASPATVWRVLTATEFDLPNDWHRKLELNEIDLTIYQIIQKAMPYMKMKPLEVVKLHEAWLKGQPEWETAWSNEQEFYKDNGYVQSYLFGRRSGNMGDDVNKIVNFGVLATEAEIMAMIEGRIEKAFPRDSCGKGTGMVYQCHDSIAVEWKLPQGYPLYWHPTHVYKPEKVKYYKRADLPKEIRDMEEKFENAFTLNIPGWEFPISGEASCGRNLKEVT